MKVLSFDLSSKCIGVFAAEISGDACRAASMPIIPPSFDPSSLGFLKSKKKMVTAKGKTLSSYVYPGEEKVSENEKKKRDRLVRSQKDIFVLQYIGREISSLLNSVRPDLVLVEKNNIFNGILTSILLAKVMGVLVGIAGEIGASLEEYSVSEVRKIFPLRSMTRNLVEGLSEDEIKKIPDITKRAIRKYLENIYDTKFLTDDESDAGAVFHYWKTEKYKGRE